MTSKPLPPSASFLLLLGFYGAVALMIYVGVQNGTRKERADDAFEAGDYDAAIHLYQEEIKNPPRTRKWTRDPADRNLTLHEKLGVTLAYRGDYSKALEQLGTAMDMRWERAQRKSRSSLREVTRDLFNYCQIAHEAKETGKLNAMRYHFWNGIKDGAPLATRLNIEREVLDELDSALAKCGYTPERRNMHMQMRAVRELTPQEQESLYIEIANSYLPPPGHAMKLIMP